MKSLLKHLKKLKLLFKARKPAEQLLDQAKDLKRGWKKVSFWVSVLGTLISMVAALGEAISPEVSLVLTTGFTVFYNLLRGLDKTEEPAVRPPLRSTEFWQGVFGEVANGMVALKSGGVDPKWFSAAQAVIAAAMAFAQNLGAHEPAPALVHPTPTKPAK